MSYFGGLSLSIRSQKGRKDLYIFVCERKQLVSHVLWLASRPRSLNCGVKPPTPRGDDPQVSASGIRRCVLHQGGGREGCPQWKLEMNSCPAGQGGAVGVQKERKGQRSSLGRDPPVPGGGLRGAPREGCCGGIVQREGLAPSGHALVPRNPSGGGGGGGLWAPEPPVSRADH